jgi:uncharacterized protein YfaQ (DUF2300 family)
VARPVVWFPSHPPLAGSPGAVADAAEALAADGAALWLHATFTGHRRLAAAARRLAPLARPWEDLLAAIDASA